MYPTLQQKPMFLHGLLGPSRWRQVCQIISFIEIYLIFSTNKKLQLLNNWKLQLVLIATTIAWPNWKKWRRKVIQAVTLISVRTNSLSIWLRLGLKTISRLIHMQHTVCLPYAAYGMLLTVSCISYAAYLIGYGMLIHNLRIIKPIKCLRTMNFVIFHKNCSPTLTCGKASI